MQLRELLTNKPLIHQSIPVEVRKHEDEDGTKTYEFVAATERAVDTSYGPEVLRMSGVNLDRYSRNPVVLDTHNRSEVGAVVGRASMEVDGDRLISRITFANTDRAAQARQLVEDGFLRAVSVGFIPRKVQNLRAGEAEGDAEGPCRIVREWELMELSLVPVPADAEALARSHYFQAETAEENPVQYPNAAERTADEPSAPPPSPEGKVVKFEEIAAERKAREIQATATAIRELAPKGMDSLAERLVLEGVSVDEARQRFLSALSTQPVGTPEPTVSPEPVEQKREVTKDVFLRSLLSL